MKKINLNVPINSLGYGVVVYNVWKQLNSLNDKLDLTLWPIPDVQNIVPPVELSEEETYQLRIDINKQSNLQNDATCLKIWHENQLEYRVGKGKFIAWPFFEVNKLDNRRLTHLKSADEIIVSSEWAKDILYNMPNWTSPAVHVVECGVDREIFNETGSLNNTEKCIFFNCGKWEVRKGHDVLHKAFKDAFSSNENVELWMMTHNPFLNEQEKVYWESLYEDSRIKNIQRVQYQHQLSEIMKQTYCGVFPAKSEGWNLEALEMMACGKQVIITDYSAHTQFCNVQNSKLIDITEEEPAYDAKWFTGDNGTWASLEGSSYEQLVQHLRDVYEQWKTKPEINQSGIETSKNLSWQKTAEKLLEII